MACQHKHALLCNIAARLLFICRGTGVGKTAMVEGLAQRIVAGDVPPGLMGAALLELDLAALAAGCMMPGEFEVTARQQDLNYFASPSRKAMYCGHG